MGRWIAARMDGTTTVHVSLAALRRASRRTSFCAGKPAGCWTWRDDSEYRVVLSAPHITRQAAALRYLES